MQQTLHDAQTLGDQRVALLIILEGDFGVRGIENDAFLQCEAAAHAARGEIAQNKLQLGNGQVTHLHQTLVDIRTQIVGRDAVALHQLEEILGDRQADAALALDAAAYGVGAGIEYAVFTGRAVLEEQVDDVGRLVEQNGFGFAVVQSFHVQVLPSFRSAALPHWAKRVVYCGTTLL